MIVVYIMFSFEDSLVLLFILLVFLLEYEIFLCLCSSMILDNEIFVMFVQ